MFPVYPLICLCGAITVDSIQKLWFRFCVRDVERGTHYLTHTAPIMVEAVLVCSLLSVSRILALYIGEILYITSNCTALNSNTDILA